MYPTMSRENVQEGKRPYKIPLTSPSLLRSGLDENPEIPGVGLVTVVKTQSNPQGPTPRRNPSPVPSLYPVWERSGWDVSLRVERGFDRVLGCVERGKYKTITPGEEMNGQSVSRVDVRGFDTRRRDPVPLLDTEPQFEVDVTP